MKEDLALIARLVSGVLVALAIAAALGAIAGVAVRVFVATSGLGG